MTSTSCPAWCTIHDDPDWTGDHYGDPLDIAAVIEHDGIPTPVALTVARTASASRQWIAIQAEETRLLDLRVDPSAAARLARAINVATGSVVDAT